MPKQKVKCEQCGVESGNITMHMRSHGDVNLAGQRVGVGGNVAETQNTSKFVTQEYLDEKLTQILNIVEKVVAQPAPAAEVKVETKEEKAAAPSDIPIPPDWNKYIDEHLGRDFGRVLSYPKNSPGQLHLSVPKELSNASPLQWSFYKVDMRNVVIDPREGFEGIKKDIDRIAKNLKLDPRMVAERNLKSI